ncbi:MAG: chemotaxis protein CheB [Armatimonadia bacterium]
MWHESALKSAGQGESMVDDSGVLEAGAESGDVTKGNRDSSPTVAGGPARQDEDGFLTIALGASAGGLNALRGFFQAMPADAGMAFVVIQHLDPERESLMVSLLAQHTAMSVVEVTEGMPLQPNRVHFIPPGQTMTVDKETLHLGAPEEPRALRLPIDAFFTSLAAASEKRAVGIVLSGTASDGTEGLRAIKANGGLTIVQSPEQAEHEWMPRNAVAAGVVDLVLNVEEIPAALLEYQQHPYVAAAELEVEGDVDALLRSVLGIISARTGHDFQGYRKSMLLRRINRRMGFRGIRSTKEYEQYLLEKPDEVPALFADFLIGVTKFFREPEAWKMLEQQVVRPLVERQSESPLRVWVPGCSNGKEAYTVAMLFFAVSEELGRPIDLQIFGTDVDVEALNQARAGLFPLDIVGEVPPEYLQRFFIGEETGFRIIQKLRKAIVFAPQNSLSDPPFSNLDLVSCRNLLIYLEPETQDRLIRIFHFALKPGGYLFLGGSEAVGPQHLFETLSKQFRIFRKTETPQTALPELRPPLRFEPGRGPAVAGPGAAQFGVDAGLSRLVEKIVLEQFAPASLVVDGRDRIVYYLGNVAEFLRQPRGEPTDQLFLRLTEALRPAVRSLMRRVRAGGPKHRTVTTVPTPEGRKPVEIEVTPLRAGQRDELLLLVLRGHDPLTVKVQAGEEDLPKTHVLEDELEGARADMQGVVEQLESSNEELTASNEEMASMNEELQAANEELETSREELQSLNEELRTVNTELAEKVEQLERANDDRDNLLRSTNIPTIFLDQELRLKMFTPPALELFNLLPTDLERPITDLSLKLQGLDLPGAARRVLETRQPVSHQVTAGDGRRYLHWTQPYLTETAELQGVVITFVDITDLEQVRAALEHRMTLQRSLALQLTQSEQRERRRLAQLLHENLQQLLAAASLKLGIVATAMPDCVEQLSGVRGDLVAAIAASRDLTMQLSPPVLSSHGLVAGLDWLVTTMRAQHGLTVATELDPAAEPAQQVVKVILFDAARELLFNSVKHSGLKQAALTLQVEPGGDTTLTVSDLGAGFDPEKLQGKPDSFGLFSIRERVELLGGKMEVESAPGQGATLRLRLPRIEAGEGGQLTV